MMATRQSIDDCLNRCESAILAAEEQYENSLRQGHYHDAEFSDAQQMLESITLELEKLSDSSNAQQREQLYRKNLQIQQLQNKMILRNPIG